MSIKAAAIHAARFVGAAIHAARFVGAAATYVAIPSTAVASTLFHGAVLAGRTAAYAYREAVATHAPLVKHDVLTAVNASEAAMDAARANKSVAFAYADVVVRSVVNEVYLNALIDSYDFTK